MLTYRTLLYYLQGLENSALPLQWDMASEMSLQEKKRFLGTRSH